MEIPKRQLETARIGNTCRSNLSPGAGRIVLSTVATKCSALWRSPKPQKASQVWPEQDNGNAPSRIVWCGATWRLSSFCHLHNLTNTEIILYDLHVNLYFVSGGTNPFGTVAHRPRIEITQDNSILNANKVYVVSPGDMFPFELILHSSVYDTLETTLVWGLFADVEVVLGNDVAKRRIASDAIFTFQHDGISRRRGWHFLYYGERELNQQDAECTDGETGFSLRRLREIWILHTARSHCEF